MPNEVIFGSPANAEHQLVIRLPHGLPGCRAHYSNERISHAEMIATPDPRIGRDLEFRQFQRDPTTDGKLAEWDMKCLAQWFRDRGASDDDIDRIFWLDPQRADLQGLHRARREVPVGRTPEFQLLDRIWQERLNIISDIGFYPATSGDAAFATVVVLAMAINWIPNLHAIWNEDLAQCVRNGNEAKRGVPQLNPDGTPKLLRNRKFAECLRILGHRVGALSHLCGFDLTGSQIWEAWQCKNHGGERGTDS